MTTIATPLGNAKRTATGVGRNLWAGVIGGGAGGLLSVFLLFAGWLLSTVRTDGGVSSGLVHLFVLYGMFILIVLIMASLIGMAIGIVAGTLLAIGISVMPRPINGWQQAAVLVTGAIMGACCVYMLLGSAMRWSPPLLQLLTWLVVGALPGLYMALLTVKLSGSARREPSAGRAS